MESEVRPLTTFVLLYTVLTVWLPVLGVAVFSKAPVFFFTQNGQWLVAISLLTICLIREATRKR